MIIRSATAADIPAMNAIYNEYIVETAVSFDTEPWSDEKRFAWFQQRVDGGYPMFVAEADGAVIGASWSGPWRDKAAYRSSAETTVVLRGDAGGRGVGTELYRTLLEAVAAAGFHRAYAIVTMPNDASVALHEKLGFRQLGVLDEVGFKAGQFHSTMLLEKKLEEGA